MHIYIYIYIYSYVVYAWVCLQIVASTEFILVVSITNH